MGKRNRRVKSSSQNQQENPIKAEDYDRSESITISIPIMRLFGEHIEQGVFLCYLFDIEMVERNSKGDNRWLYDGWFYLNYEQVQKEICVSLWKQRLLLEELAKKNYVTLKDDTPTACHFKIDHTRILNGVLNQKIEEVKKAKRGQ